MSAQIYFSLYGETDRAEKMRPPGAGGLRVMKITRSMILPSCAIVPQIVNLPTCSSTLWQGFSGMQLIDRIDETFKTDRFSNNRINSPCPLCKTLMEDRLCQTCPSTDLPHARHDHDPAVVGDKRGICSMCSVNYLPTGGPAWRDCACGMDIGLMEERMKRVRIEDQVETRNSEVAMNDKEEAERGRRR